MSACPPDGGPQHRRGGAGRARAGHAGCRPPRRRPPRRPHRVAASGAGVPVGARRAERRLRRRGVDRRRRHRRPRPDRPPSVAARSASRTRRTRAGWPTSPRRPAPASPSAGPARARAPRPCCCSRADHAVTQDAIFGDVPDGAARPVRPVHRADAGHRRRTSSCCAPTSAGCSPTRPRPSSTAEVRQEAAGADRRRRRPVRRGGDEQPAADLPGDRAGPATARASPSARRSSSGTAGSG